jgi:hypothetical protein
MGVAVTDDGAVEEDAQVYDEELRSRLMGPVSVPQVGRVLA